MNRKAQLERELQNILRVLQRDFQPDRVILFGSLLSGQVQNQSDIDLLIIKKTEDPLFERAPRLEKLLKRKCAADLIILTPHEIREMTEAKNPYLLDILERGKALYDAAA